MSGGAVAFFALLLMRQGKHVWLHMMNMIHVLIWLTAAASRGPPNSTAFGVLSALRRGAEATAEELATLQERALWELLALFFLESSSSGGMQGWAAQARLGGGCATRLGVTCACVPAG